MPKLTLVDPRTLVASQLSEAKKFFKLNKKMTFLPAHQIGIDQSRAKLDEFILQALLGVANLTTAIEKTKLVRAKLSNEPSFNGGK